MKSLLNLEIRHTFQAIHYTKQTITNLSTHISTHISPSEFESLSLHISSITQSSLLRTKQKLIQKFNNLFDRSNQSKTYPHTESSWIQNISSNPNIPHQVTNILALGPNFSSHNSTDTKHFPKLITDIESIHKDDSFKINIEDRDLSRQHISNIITNHLHNPTSVPSPLQPQFYSDLKITRSFLKSHDDLIVTRADKSNKSIIMDKSEYIDKIHFLLSDTNTYIPTYRNKDPTPSLQKQFNTLLQKLLTSKQINRYTYNSLIAYNTIAPRIYGLPKLHKPNNPLRPIVSNINSPASNLSKFLLPPLQALSKHNPFDIPNSFDLKILLSSLTIPTNFILTSFDAESLFTNIPIDTALHIINSNWSTIETHTNLSQSSFLESLSLCLKSGYLSFQNQFFTQANGLAMGNCLAPDISGIVLNDLLNSIMSLFPNDILFLKKYVDDLLLIINPLRLPDILDAFNSYHSRLKFTVEMEHNNSLPFLDLLLIHNPDGSISTNWYTKPTFSGRLLNYSSFHPHHQKLNVAHNLIHRALTLSDPIYHADNKLRVTSILQTNGYPNHLIHKLIRNFYNHQQTPHTPPPQSSSQTPPFLYRSIPYIPQLADKLKKSLQHTFPNIRIAFSTHNKTSSLFTPLKDPIPLSQRSNLIYRIPCITPNCNGTYIGQTKNQLHSRIKQHQYNIKNKQECTALAQHTLIEKHQFDFKNVTILATEKNPNKRIISETVHISLQPNPVNSKKDLDNISDAYKNIFHILKNQKTV